MADTAIRHLKLVVSYEGKDADAASAQHHMRERNRIRDTAKEHERAAKEANALLKQFAREQDQAARASAREREGLNRQLNALVKQTARDEERQAKQIAAEKKKADRDTFQAWKAQADQQHKLAMSHFAEEQREQEEFRANIGKIGQAIGGLATGALAVFASHFGKIREDAYSAAEDVMRMRSAVRELQALRGELGDTGAGVAHVVKGAAQTLQTPQEYQAMESAGRGIAELSIAKPGEKLGNGKVMTSEEFERALNAAGKMQAMEGGDAAGAGQLMGQIVLQSKDRLTPEEAEGIYNKLYKIQQPGGFTNLTQAAGQYAGMNGYIMNDVYSREEAMSLLSAFSVAKPEEAGSRADQFTRAMMAGRIRNRGMAAPKDIDITKSGDYFKSLGITDQDTVMQRGAKVSDDLMKQEVAAKAAGRQFNALEYLMTHGINNTEDAQSIMLYSGLRKEGKLAEIEKAAKAPLDKGAISRQFEEKRRTDQRLRTRTLEVTEQAQRATSGVKEDPLAEVQRAAFNELFAQGKVTGTFEEWKKAGFGQRLAENTFYNGPGTYDLSFPGTGGYHNQVNKRAQEMLRAERKRLGLPAMPSYDRGKGILGLMGRSEEDMMAQSAREIREKGGDPLRGAAEKLDKAAGRLEEATRKMTMPAALMPAPKGR